MLDVLKKLNTPGSKEDIIFFLQSIVGKNALLYKDICVLCSYAPAGHKLHVDRLIDYCTCFGWLKRGSSISISEELVNSLDNTEKLNEHLVRTTLSTLFSNNVFVAEMFVYDVEKERLVFRNELLPLPYAAIRNVLISQSFLCVDRTAGFPIFWVHSDYENLVADYCKESSKKLSLEQLKARLEANALAGSKAEEYVLDFERRRVTRPELSNRIKIISEIDVCAGYDIISYESDTSVHYDRFIEVKAISKGTGFYWSKNEISIAKIKGNQYYLYLVDLSQISKPDYIPMIIQNPAFAIAESTDWYMEAESYHIRKVMC